MSYKYSRKLDSMTIILRKLNNGERVTIAGLTSELNVGERPVYRYLESLQVAGYPIYFDRAGMSYRFVENFRLKNFSSKNDFKQVLDIDRQVVNQATVAIAAYRSCGDCVLSNGAMNELFGNSEAAIYSQNFRDIQSWKESGLLEMAEETLANGREQSGDFRMLSASGFDVWFHCKMTVISRDGERYLVMMAQNLTPRMKKEIQVARFFVAINSHPSVVMITETDGTIKYVSDKVEAMTGYAAEEVIGKNPRIFRSEVTKPELYRALWSTISEGCEWSGEICNRRKDGTFYWEHMRISPIFDADNVITNFVALKEDITRQKELDEELFQYAVLDTLTGAYNQRIFTTLGNREISMARRYGRPITILLLDVDALAKVNHHNGYPSGDEVLKRVAEICRTQMRGTDILSRFNGDSFALLLPEADRNGAYHVAERIRRGMKRAVFAGRTGNFSCTVSIAGATLSGEHQGVDCMLRACRRLLHRNCVHDMVAGFHGDPSSSTHDS